MNFDHGTMLVVRAVLPEFYHAEQGPRALRFGGAGVSPAIFVPEFKLQHRRQDAGGTSTQP
jgi:hypothetical protein